MPKELARDKIFEHPQKAGLEIIAHQSLQNILDAFIPLTTPNKTLSFKEQRFDVYFTSFRSTFWYVAL